MCRDKAAKDEIYELLIDVALDGGSGEPIDAGLSNRPAMHHAAWPVLRLCLHKAVIGPEIEQR